VKLFKSLALALLSTLSVWALAAEEPAIVELRVLSPRISHDIVFAAVQDCTRRG
jgi:hypothetical protein